MKQLPRNLKSDGRFTGAGCQRQQNSVITIADFFKHPANGNLLIKANVPGAAFVGVGHSRKAVTPGVLLGKAQSPQRFWARKGRNVAFNASGHVDAINGLPVSRIAVAYRQLGRITLGLRHAFGVRFVPGFGLNHRQLGVTVDQHVVGNLGLGAYAAALQPPLGDTKLAPHHAAFHHAPACGS